MYVGIHNVTNTIFGRSGRPECTIHLFLRNLWSNLKVGVNVADGGARELERELPIAPGDVVS
jgi:hypothetical protein